MNVFTVLPNYYLNQMASPQLFYQQSTLKGLPLLNILSQALKTSIINYENALLSENQNENLSKNNQEMPSAKKQLEQKRQTPKEELQLRTENHFKTQIQNKDPQLTIVNENGQKQGKQSSHDFTNDSDVQEQPEKQLEKKTRQHTRRIKKDKNRRRKDLINLKIENMNLLQHADVPRLGVNFEELKGRRESLMQRMVIVWDEKFKDRKDRREIRMLNF